MGALFYLIGGLIVAASFFVGVNLLRASQIPAAQQFFGSELAGLVGIGVIGAAIQMAIVGLLLIGFGRILDHLAAIRKSTSEAADGRLHPPMR